jgi:hypothetical protein
LSSPADGLISLAMDGLNLNRNILDFMRWPQNDLGAQDLNGFNGQNHFKKVAGSKVIDEYYNTYLRKQVQFSR